MKTKSLSLDVDALIDIADEVHLNSRMGPIEKRAVRESVDNEVGAEGSIDMREQVAVERGGDSPLVVVGVLESLGVFDEVDPNQELATVRSEELSESLK